MVKEEETTYYIIFVVVEKGKIKANEMVSRNVEQSREEAASLRLALSFTID